MFGQLSRASILHAKSASRDMSLPLRRQQCDYVTQAAVRTELVLAPSWYSLNAQFTVLQMEA